MVPNSQQNVCIFCAICNSNELCVIHTLIKCNMRNSKSVVLHFFAEMPKMSSTQKNPNLADMEVRVVSEYI